MFFLHFKKYLFSWPFSFPPMAFPHIVLYVYSLGLFLLFLWHYPMSLYRLILLGLFFQPYGFSPYRPISSLFSCPFSFIPMALSHIALWVNSLGLFLSSLWLYPTSLYRICNCIFLSTLRPTNRPRASPLSKWTLPPCRLHPHSVS